MKILLTAQQRGSTNALAPIAKELSRRGHDLTIYATGNENEAAGFQDLYYKLISLSKETEDYANLVKDYNAVVVGLSGYYTPDGYFLRAANHQKIPTFAIQCQNSHYLQKLGINPADLPTFLAMIGTGCIDTMRKELPSEMADEAVKSSTIIGWTAFDHYAKLRDNFNQDKKEKILSSLEINPNNPLNLHLTQNIHPSSRYITEKNISFDEWAVRFNYEMGVTRFTFEAASDLGLKLVVKPHPGEEYTINYTKELADRHGFQYIPANACSTQELMLAANSITAGRSTSLTEATLLDRNCGGIIPDIQQEEIDSFPALTLGAIPYTQNWDWIKNILKQVTSQDEAITRQLAKDRLKFSVDGKASKRLADLIENVCHQY